MVVSFRMSWNFLKAEWSSCGNAQSKSYGAELFLFLSRSSYPGPSHCSVTVGQSRELPVTHQPRLQNGTGRPSSQGCCEPRTQEALTGRSSQDHRHLDPLSDEAEFSACAVDHQLPSHSLILTPDLSHCGRLPGQHLEAALGTCS